MHIDASVVGAHGLGHDPHAGSQRCRYCSRELSERQKRSEM
jgi:hypothetical protein